MPRLGAVGLLAATTLILVLVAGTASAHLAPEPLENELHVLEDHPQDELYFYDGYDLHHLHAREAYMEDAQAHGIVFRFALYGGFAPAGTAQALHIDIEATGPDGTETVRLSTPDDEQWDPTHGHLVYANVTEDDLPWTGVTAQLQWFVPYEAFGAQPGDQLEAVTMYSWADEDLRAKAPGGIIVPHTGGQGEIPPAAEVESHRYVDPLELDGPDGYVDVYTETNASHVTVLVKSAVSNGQHVTIDPQDAPGWTVESEGPTSIPIDADGTAWFPLRVNASQDANTPLPVRITTDLGADRTLYIGTTGSQLVTAQAPDEVDVTSDPIQQRTPFLPSSLIGALLLALAARVKR